MKVIESDTNYKYEINKSVFITNLIKVKTKDEVLEKLEFIKEKYKDATHNCYAYIIDDIKKSSDDNEPGGTAGVPIMEVLLKNEINYVLCVVTRYFGGIKLGAGGLVRAYSTSVSNTIKATKLLELVNGYKIKIEIDYSNQKKLEYILKDNTYSKIYNEMVNYIVECTNKALLKLDENNIKYEILDNIKIELTN